jgi:hypothetical protein
MNAYEFIKSIPSMVSLSYCYEQTLNGKTRFLTEPDVSFLRGKTFCSCCTPKDELELVLGKFTLYAMVIDLSHKTPSVKCISLPCHEMEGGDDFYHSVYVAYNKDIKPKEMKILKPDFLLYNYPWDRVCISDEASNKDKLEYLINQCEWKDDVYFMDQVRTAILILDMKSTTAPIQRVKST